MRQPSTSLSKSQLDEALNSVESAIRSRVSAPCIIDYGNHCGGAVTEFNGHTRALNCISDSVSLKMLADLRRSIFAVCDIPATKPPGRKICDETKITELSMVSAIRDHLARAAKENSQTNWSPTLRREVAWSLFEGLAEAALLAASTAPRLPFPIRQSGLALAGLSASDVFVAYADFVVETIARMLAPGSALNIDQRVSRLLQLADPAPSLHIARFPTYTDGKLSGCISLLTLAPRSDIDPVFHSIQEDIDNIFSNVSGNAGPLPPSPHPIDLRHEVLKQVLRSTVHLVKRTAKDSVDGYFELRVSGQTQRLAPCIAPIARRVGAEIAAKEGADAAMYSFSKGNSRDERAAITSAIMEIQRELPGHLEVRDASAPDKAAPAPTCSFHSQPIRSAADQINYALEIDVLAIQEHAVATWSTAPLCLHPPLRQRTFPTKTLRAIGTAGSGSGLGLGLGSIYFPEATR